MDLPSETVDNIYASRASMVVSISTILCSIPPPDQTVVLILLLLLYPLPVNHHVNGFEAELSYHHEFEAS